MKKKRIIRVLIVLICLLVMVGAVLLYQKQEQKEVEQELLRRYYRQQNRVLPQKLGTHSSDEAYIGYDEVDESELYVYLTAYNEYIESHDMDAQELTLEDIKDYLSSEYNEDGSLRIYRKYRLTLEEFLSGEYDVTVTPMYDIYKYVRYENYPHIYAYVDWYHTYAGKEYIEEYWGELGRIKGEYCEQNPGIINVSVFDLSIDQLQELINKKNDPSYVISMEVMEGAQ